MSGVSHSIHAGIVAQDLVCLELADMGLVLDEMSHAELHKSW